MSSPPDILDIVQWSAKEGTLLASCQPEVKELMHQISQLLSTESRSLNTLKQQLQSRDKELSSLRLAVHEKTIQVDKLRTELAQTRRELKIRTSDHETQLLRLRSELNRLNKCYEKLKSRKLKLSVGGVQKSESDDKASFIEVLERRCEAYLEQIDDQRISLDQLKNVNDELTGKYIQCQREVAKLESEIQRVQSREGMEEELLAKDKKIAQLKKERDIARLQAKDSLAESDKWYNQSMRLSVLNKESESRVNDIVRQLNELHQTVKKDEQVRIQEIVDLKRSLVDKENIIRELTSGRVRTGHQNEVQMLKLNLQTMSLNEKRLREENNELKKRLEESSTVSVVQNELKTELDRRETELHENRVNLLKKDTELQSYQERISHLEDLLSVATDQANSSHDTSHSSDNSIIVLNGFQEKLSNIMTTHFTRIDQSLQNALTVSNN